MNEKEEFQMQQAKADLRVLAELKSYTDLCNFYKDHFDVISSYIEQNWPNKAVAYIEGLGMPKTDEISYSDVFIQQINSAIKRGHIKKSDL